MNIDYEDLNTASIELLAFVMEHAPARFSVEEKNVFEQSVFKKILEFMRRDAACTLEQSITLFKQAFNDSPLSNLSVGIPFAPAKQEAHALYPKLDFTPYAAVYVELDPSMADRTTHLRKIEDEVLRCQQSIENNKPYHQMPLYILQLASSAKEKNALVFERYYNNLKKEYTLFTSSPSDMANMLDPVIEQVQTLQDLFSSVDFSTAIEKHRATPALKEGRTIADVMALFTSHKI